MRKAILPILCVAALVGCSDEGGASSQSRRDFQAALAKFNAANSGFVADATAGPQASVDFPSYREKQLTEATDALRKLMDSGPEALQAQKNAARLLVSMAESGQADAAARRAMGEWADISRRSTSVVGQALIVNHAADLAQTFRTDLSALITPLKQEQGETDTAIKTLEGEQKELSAKVAQMQKQVDDLLKQSEDKRIEAQTQRNAAFGKVGKGQEDLYTAAAVLRGQATDESRDGQIEAASLDVVRSELALVEKQLELRRAAGKSLEEQVANLEQQQAHAVEEQKAAVDAKDTEIAALQKRAGDISSDFKAKVEQPLDAAQKRAQAAIETLDPALKRAGRDKQFQAANLSEQTVLAGILTQRVIAESGYLKTMELLAAQGERLGVSSFSGPAGEAKKNQDSLVVTAKDVIGKASSVAAEIGGNDETAARYRDQLDGYSRLVDQSVNGFPAPAPAAAPAATAPADSN